MRGTLALVVAINGLVLFNALAHDVSVAYDARDHLDYVDCLAQGRLPGPDCTRESFSPPLPYVPAALWRRFAGGPLEDAARAGLLFNVVWSIALCGLLVALCRLSHPPGSACERWTLALLGLMPAYYRSFAMVRGEPMLAVAALAVVYLFARAQKSGRRKDYALLGAACGGAALCRQWFFLMVPGLLLAACLGNRQERRRAAAGLAPAALAGLAVGGWFYLWHLARFGHLPWLASEPAAFTWPALGRYLGVDWAAFADPFGIYRTRRALPALYADWWGDVQGYFLVYGRDAAGRYVSGAELIRSAAAAGNREAIRPWLAAALVAAAVPLGAIFAGFWKALRERRPGPAAAALCALTSIGGLAAWAFFYSADNPAWTKATYLLMTLPWLAYLGGEAAPRGGRAKAAAFALAAAALFLLPLCATRFLTAPFDGVRRLYPEELFSARNATMTP